jgi:predicted transcriptional regulator
MSETEEQRRETSLIQFTAHIVAAFLKRSQVAPSELQGGSSPFTELWEHSHSPGTRRRATATRRADQEIRSADVDHLP